MGFWIPQKSSCTQRAVSQLPWADLNQHNAKRTGLALLAVFGDRSFGKARIIWSMISQQLKLVCAGTGRASGCAFPSRSQLDQSSQANDFFLFVVLIFLPPWRPELHHAGESPKSAFFCAKNVHRSSGSIRTDLDKEAMRLSARETRLIQSVGQRLSCYGFPLYLQTHLYLLFLLFKHHFFVFLVWDRSAPCSGSWQCFSFCWESSKTPQGCQYTEKRVARGTFTPTNGRVIKTGLWGKWFLLESEKS